MSSKSTQTTQQTSAPWSAQAPYLQSAFQQASSANDKANATTYTGDQVAQFTPEQLASFRSMVGYGSNSTQPGQTAAAGGAATSAGMGALSSGLSSLQGFTPQGGTDSNIAAATAYANNPATDGMIDAAMRDARRSVSEDVLPQVARSAATSGNAMSSRRAISEGLVERGLADKTADTSATIRGNQFNTGLQLAEQARQADNASRLNAATSTAAAGNGALSTGINGLASSIDQQKGLFDIANGGGSGLQASNQAAIDNAKGTSEYANDNLWKNLQNMFGIIGSNNWGGTSSGTQESSPSFWNVLGGLMGAGGQLASAFMPAQKQPVWSTGAAGSYVYPQYR